MIKHLLTITLRNMTKQKVRSIISIPVSYTHLRAHET